MFRFLKDKLVDWLAFKQTRDLLQSNEWMRQVLLVVHHDLHGEPDENTALYIQHLHSAGEEARLEFASELAEKVNTIALAEDQKEANRLWLLQTSAQYAPLKILFFSSPDELGEIYRHPCLFGMQDHLIEILENQYTETVSEHGGLYEASEYLRFESLRLHYLMFLSSLIRQHLNDEEEEGDDWFPIVFASMMASTEVELRRKMGLKVPCDQTRIRNEAQMLRMNAANMEADLYKNVRKAKIYEDWTGSVDA